MLTKEQDGKLSMLTMICNLPVTFAVSWYFVMMSALDVWLSVLLIIALSIPSYLAIRAKLKQRLYPDPER